MKIGVLDRFSLGMDTPFDLIASLGELTVYDSTPADKIAERCKDLDVVIINKIKFTEEILDKCKSLKLICVFATGYDNIDIAAAKRNGIAVCNVPGYSTDSVALFTIATVLSLATHLNAYNRYVSSGEYTASGIPNKLVPVYHEIKGKTWGIIGYGNIGKAVGKIAEAMGAQILINKRTPLNDKKCVDIETLCRESDIITVHCPLTPQTKGLINETTISTMKNDVILVNEARGAVLDEAAVANAIEKGKIGAFGCDVYSREPFDTDHPFNRIMKLDNVILTPHAAWGSYEARVRCISIIRDNIQSFIDSKTLNRVDI